MRYKSLKQCVDDLDRNGHLIRIDQEVDPHLEMAEIHRRVFQANGPAIYYANVKDSPFPAVSNLFGTLDRSRFLFRSTLRWVQRLIEAKADPVAFLRAPWRARDCEYCISYIAQKGAFWCGAQIQYEY